MSAARFLPLLLHLSLATLSCARSHPEPVPGHAERAPKDSKDEAPQPADEHEKLPTRVRVSAEVIAAAGIKTAPVLLKSLPLTVELTGEVAADPDHAARITTRVPGRVIEVRFKEGDRVAAGALLIVLESVEMARTRAELQATLARAQAAQRNAARLSALANTGLAAGQEVAAAQAEAQSLSAQAAAAHKTLAATTERGDTGSSVTTRVELRAPIAGVVLSRDAVQGETLEAGHLLAELADLDTAYFLARVFEKNLQSVHSGEKAEVRLNAYPSEIFAGTVERIGKQLDPAARTVVARIAIRDRQDLLKVGLFGKARVTSPVPLGTPPRLVVPRGAVTHLAEQDVVFVQTPDEDFAVHPVKLGRSADGQVEILGGLRAGEQVVTEGVFTLKSLVLKSSFGEED